MQFFIDGADLKEIEALQKMGLVDGVTTNPSIIAATKQPIRNVIRDICSLVEGPVSAEVVATDIDNMMDEAHILAEIADNVAVKVPLTEAGLQACYRLRAEDIMVNVTLCFSAAQALLAAKAGATFISPFVGRLDDIGHDGMTLIEEIFTIYRNSPIIDTQILAASVRHPQHILQAAQIGADIVTASPKVYWQMLKHPLTEKGLDIFLADWAKTGQKGI